MAPMSKGRLVCKVSLLVCSSHCLIDSVWFAFYRENSDLSAKNIRASPINGPNVKQLTFGPSEAKTGAPTDGPYAKKKWTAASS